MGVYNIILNNMVNATYRKCVDFKGTKSLSSVVIVGHYKYLESQPPLRPHCHPGMFEMVIIKKGRQIYTIGGRRYELHGGDMFFTGPDEVHGTGSEPESKGEIYWTEIQTPAGNKGILGLSGSETRELVATLRKIKTGVYHGCAGLASVLHGIIYNERKASMLGEVQIRNMMVSFLLGVIDAANNQHGERFSAGVKKAVSYMSQNLSENVSLSRIAEISGMSESYLKSSFFREVGVPPLEYRMRLRIEKAKLLIAEKRLSITDIANELGFASSQHFATVFKKIAGVQPGRYRNSVEANTSIERGAGVGFHPIVGRR